MPTVCLAAVQACLSGEPWQPPPGVCRCSLPADGAVCTTAPNQLTALHALAMAAAPAATVAAAAAGAPQVGALHACPGMACSSGITCGRR